MGESDVHLIHAVFKALEIIAGHSISRRGIDDAFGRRFRKRRKRRRLAGPEIGKDLPHIFTRGIDFDFHLAIVTRLLCWLFHTLTSTVVFPSMIHAADVIVFDPPEMHLRTAMRASLVYDLGAARRTAIE